MLRLTGTGILDLDETCFGITLVVLDCTSGCIDSIDRRETLEAKLELYLRQN